jgi:hypothetical protein
MTYFSKTGSTVSSSRQDQTTSPNIDGKIGVVSNGAVYHVVDESRHFTKRVTEDIVDSTKEELSKEEEDKFYKKVFRTSII